MILTLLTGFILMIIMNWSAKVDFHKMKIGKTPMTAEIVEYRYEQVPIRNDYTKIPYPYVKVPGVKDRLVKLKYASSPFKPFKIGEKVDVFWYGGVLYYWHAGDRGLSKLLPNRWDFWNRNKTETPRE